MSAKSKAAPMSEREWRRRVVQLLRVQAGEIDVPGTHYPTPKHYSKAARKRVVEALYAEMGERAPWDRPAAEEPRRTRGRPEPIDVGPIKAAWDEVQRDRLRRYAAYDIALDNRGRRARCKRCGETLLDVPDGLVGATPSALYIWHSQQTGCV